MERKDLIICGLAGFLGLVSTATGFAAEATRVKYTECEHQRSLARSLGLTAALALLNAQGIINRTIGCICCGRNPHPSNSRGTTVVFCLAVSWFTFVIAFFSLLVAALLNGWPIEENGNYDKCRVVKPGVFGGGAVLSLATVTLGIISYITFTSAKNNTDQRPGNAPVPNQGGVAMGHPQFPPQTGVDPVFVHEDTYMRRQFT